MRNKIDFYFFCLFNFYYKDGLRSPNFFLKNKVIPQNHTCVILGVGGWLWSVVLRVIYKILFDHSFSIFFLGMYFEILIWLILWGLFQFVFVNNNKYTAIYTRFRNTDQVIQRRTRSLIFTFLCLPIVLVPLSLFIIVKFFHMPL